nr:hypothetical protein [uncultured Desulfuromonas sp.]
MQIKSQINFDEMWYDLYLWNADTAQYEDDMTCADLSEENTASGASEHVIPFETSIPLTVAQQLSNELVSQNNTINSDYLLYIRLVVDSSNVVAELCESDNSTSAMIAVYFFPATQ